MEMVLLIFTVIWYQLFFSPPKKNLKVCWWINKLQRWVFLVIIWMMHHMPKQWGGIILLTLFCTLPNVSFSIKQKKTATLIDEAWLKSLYSRLVFKFIKYFATSPNFEEACEQFHYESVKSKNRRNKNWLKILSNHPTTCYNYSWQSNWIQWI